jgi:transposase
MSIASALIPAVPPDDVVQHLLPDHADLALDHLTLDADGITLAVASTQAMAGCPLCQAPATRVQSRYTRTLLDLPWATRRVRLQLTVRRFVCPTVTCPRRIFTERLPHVAAPYARRTTRLQERLLTIGFALGGQAGARQCATWRIAVSGTTLLHLLRQHVPAPGPTPRVLGVDEFARRKGRTYATILVDLERHAVVDLLPENSNAGFANWLHAHPGVEFISRDRGEAYGTGATAGAPAAIQVADRWHILKNLSDALQKVLARHTAGLRQAAQECAPACAEAAVPAVLPPKRRPRTPKPVTRSAQRLRQLAMHQRVHDLVAEGWSVAAIARELQLQRTTVRKYRDLVQFRDLRTTARPSAVEPHRAYVEQRWAEGCTEVKQLWEELQSRGFRGRYKSVWQFTRGWQPPDLPQALTPAPVQPAPVVRTPRQATWLLVRPPEALEPAEISYRDALCRACPEAATAYALAQAFTELLRTRAVDALDPWLLQAQQCGVREVARFALGLRKDYAAVRAALEYPFSNGQTEAQVNRVKHVKRQMYGRAKFDLLRARVLYRPDP